MRTTVSETMEKMNEQGVVHYAIEVVPTAID